MRGHTVPVGFLRVPHNKTFRFSLDLFSVNVLEESRSNKVFHSAFSYQGGCIAKLENFIMDHLKLIGAVGVGVASVQVRHAFHFLSALSSG